MNSVLIVDPDPVSRLRLESGLSESNQFSGVFSCGSLSEVDRFVPVYKVSVIVLVQQLASDQAALDCITQAYPDVGLVLLTDEKQHIDEALLSALGIHAQTSTTASPLELMVTVAKAMVCRLKPPKRMRKTLFGRFMKD